MKIIIETKNNGLHAYATIDISEPKSEQYTLMKQLIDVVEEFNDREVRDA